MAHAASPAPSTAAPLVAIGTGAVVALALGLYAGAHTPTGQPITTLGFSSMFAMKVWLAVVAGVLALGQLVGGLWMYGRLGRAAPAWVGPVHRSLGFLAVLVSLPVAYHCLWALGFGTADLRTLLHSVLGCVFYGAFVVKVFSVQGRSEPKWLLPWSAATMIVALAIVVSTSALWYLTTIGTP
jgi:Family of unknown function (DUF6529)